MSNWSEKDTDRLFQQGSERYDFEYDPAAWDQMEKLLDRHKRRRRLLWWLFGIGVGLLVVLGVFFLQGNDFTEGKPDGAREQGTVVSPQAEIQPETKIFPNNHSEEEASQQATENRLIPDDSNQTGKLLPPPPPSSRLPTDGSDVFPNQRKELEKVPPTAAKNGTGEADGPHENTLHPPGEVADLDEHPTETGGRAAPLRSDVSRLPALSYRVWRQAETPVLSLAELPPVGSDSAGGNPDDEEKTANGLLFGLALGPEWNSAGIDDFSRRNWKYGAHVEYRHRGRYGVSLGANFIRMEYDAGQGDYTPKPGFWTNMTAPQSTRGLCDMLEIPLTVSYHFSGHRNSGFFASAGFSSYWILEEHYWYNYENPTPDLVFYWGTQKDERNWLNLGLVSFGYQHQIVPRLWLSVAPYAQVPLTGVGHGAVKIYSMGLQTRVDFQVK